LRIPPALHEGWGYCARWNERAPGLGSYWQSASTDTVSIHHDNAARYFDLRQNSQDCLHSGDDIGVAPIAVAEEDQARFGGPSQGEQAWKVKIDSDNRSTILFRASNNVGVRRAAKS